MKAPINADRHGASSAWLRDASVAHGAPARIYLNGEPFEAFEGESLAIALAVGGVLALRRSPGLNQPRGMFCLMGVCQECVVLVDGEAVPACMEPVRDGMRVSLNRFSPPSAGEGDV